MRKRIWIVVVVLFLALLALIIGSALALDQSAKKVRATNTARCSSKIELAEEKLKFLRLLVAQERSSLKVLLDMQKDRRDLVKLLTKCGCKPIP